MSVLQLLLRSTPDTGVKIIVLVDLHIMQCDSNCTRDLHITSRLLTFYSGIYRRFHTCGVTYIVGKQVFQESILQSGVYTQSMLTVVFK